eukprot:m.77904 g.77904  ORF g.77904 m.77904 type:complete len:405 (+) comp14088_c0_seq1:219-1433(+)
MRAVAVLLAVVAISAQMLLGAASSSFSVLGRPSFVALNEDDATMLSSSDIGDVIKGSLGLNAEKTWNGVVRTTAFDVPKRSLHVSISGCDSACKPDDRQAEFALISEGPASLSDVSSAITRAFGPNSLITPSQLSTADVNQLLSVLATVNGVSVTESTLSIHGMTVDITNDAVAAVVAQLISLLQAVNAINDETQTPVVVVQDLSLAAISNKDRAAVTSLVKAVLSHATAILAAESDSSLATVTITSQEAKRTVARRDLTAITPTDNNAGLLPNSTAWVEYCHTYKCFCSTDSDGKPWDPTTRCSTSCTANEPCSNCVYTGCDCKTGVNVIPALSQCVACKDGFILHGNHCYLDSDMPVAANIIIGLGVLTFVSLLATCIALGGMDPGYDSVIYRMTQQRIKAQ